MLNADCLGSIAGVVFDDVDDNGVFDAGTDLPLQGVTVTLTREDDPDFLEKELSNVGGEYRFDGLTAGVYSVTQESVVGLRQRPDVMQQTVIKTADDAMGVSGTTIDAFESFVAVTATPDNTPVSNFAQAPTSEVIGGQRELFANLTSPQGFVDLAVNPDGNNPVLQFDSAAMSSSERSVVWDGSTDKGDPGVDFGLDVDLTNGGAEALVVRVQLDNLPIDLTIRVYRDDSNYSDATISLPGGISAETRAFVLPYDQFIDNGIGADFTQVTAIELFHDSSAPAVTAQIEYIGTLGPMQVDFPNVELGISLEKSTNGEDADTPTGPVLPVGDLAFFIYAVGNTGNVALSITDITDDHGTPDESDDFSPTPVEIMGFNVGDTNMDNLLDTDESWQYVADRIVTAGQFTNVARVIAEDPQGAGMVDAEDPSNHFGLPSQIGIDKLTNGEDADTPTGPRVPVGDPVVFSYFICNMSIVPLTIMSVTDDNGTPEDSGDDFPPAPVEMDGFNVGDINMDGLLDEDETWLYEANSTATAGQYTNIGKVMAVDPFEQLVMAEDPSNYFGTLPEAEPGVRIEKLTNDEDADLPTGPVVQVGELVAFTYQVSNVGNVPLRIVEVSDNNGTPDDPEDDFSPSPVQVDGFNVGDLNMNGLLDELELWVYQADHLATPGQYTNIGLVMAEDMLGEIVMDTDPSNHFGMETEPPPAVDIQKLTNGEDADTPTGPIVLVGELVDFTYLVSNEGDVVLQIQQVSDDNGTPDDPQDDFSPSPVEMDGFNVGDVNMNGLLDETETWLYEANRPATRGQYTNIGMVMADDSLGETVMDVDPSNYFGVDPNPLPAIRIEKSTNGEDADTPTGPIVREGDLIDFSYQVSNIGNIPLRVQQVSDDNGTPDNPEDDFSPSPVEMDGFNVGDANMNGLLDETETWQYEANRPATRGQYTNTGMVLADDLLGETVMDIDPSNYFGVAPNPLPAIRIEKSTNGEDADTPTGPIVREGESVDFSYQVSNSGNIPLRVQRVSDDNGTPDDPEDDFSPSPVEIDGFNVGDVNMNGLLDETETWQYEGNRPATRGQYTNIGMVMADDLLGETVMDIDPSNYFGVAPNPLPAIRIEKSTNGEDADAPTGPIVRVGDLVDFSYQVSNSGNIPLLIQEVSDNNGTPDDPQDDFSPSPVEMDGFNVGDANRNDLLDETETWLYAANRPATRGQYTNIGMVMADDLLGETVMDIDPSNYFGLDPELVVIGNDTGTNSRPFVTVVDPETGEQLGQFLAYESGYTGGVRVATGDLNGDGVAEIITAPGKSHVPEIRVFSRQSILDPDSWQELTEFRTLAYAADFAGGVNIAVGDVDGDGRNDIVTTPSKDAAETKVFRNVFGVEDDPIRDIPYRQFFAFEPNFISGSVVTLADLNSDGLADVVVGNAGGMRSTVNVFDVANTPEIIRTFLPFSAQMRGGVSMDLGDITGDGVPDLIVGAGYRGASAVEVFDGNSGFVNAIHRV